MSAATPLAITRIPHCPTCGSPLYDGSNCPDCGHT